MELPGMNLSLTSAGQLSKFEVGHANPLMQDI
jgi:hypothetical protein